MVGEDDEEAEAEDEAEGEDDEEEDDADLERALIGIVGLLEVDTVVYSLPPIFSSAKSIFGGREYPTLTTLSKPTIPFEDRGRGTKLAKSGETPVLPHPTQLGAVKWAR